MRGARALLLLLMIIPTVRKYPLAGLKQTKHLLGRSNNTQVLSKTRQSQFICICVSVFWYLPSPLYPPAGTEPEFSLRLIKADDDHDDFSLENS